MLHLTDIHAAADRIRDFVIRTPVLDFPELDEQLGARLFFKCENMQHGGAFKARGACNAVLSLTDEDAARGVVAHSSGNHAAAVARAAKLRGITARIVMPRNSRAIKIEAVRKLGVEPEFCEPDSASREAAAQKIIDATGAVPVHPFNDVNVIAGQGTASLELLEQTSQLDVIVVPVGGGGLLSGTLIAVKSVRPDIRVIAAEPALADDAFRSLSSGQIQQPTRYDTIADGLRTALGSITFPIIHEQVDEILLASEDSILAATRMLLNEAKLVVEPSGAVPLACVMQHPERFRNRRVGLIISGGNIDAAACLEVSTEPARRRL
ncbi:MAG: pyridoxal-phosphate dependent enzyme [Planctomycetaceae bacterium]